MRVLVVLNEYPPGSHPDMYEAFDRLAESGIIGSYRVYSHLLARARGLSDARISGEILELVQDGRYDLVLWMHTRTLGVTDATLQAIERMPQRPLMAYWEKDSYHPLFDPMPRAMLTIMRHCVRVFVPCGGPLLATLRRAGVSEVRFAPSTTSGTRFLPLWNAAGPFEHDIVLIGNRVSSRIPFKTMPGARKRQFLVRALERRFGSRFAVYGTGWQGPSARGPCGYDDQQRVNASARIAIGANNSTYPFVFSDRLPIALACGVPLLYGRNPGFDKVFGPHLANRFFDSIPQAIALAEALLTSDDGSVTAESRANRAFLEENLSAELVARYVISETVASKTLAHGTTIAVTEGERPSPKAWWQQIPPLIARGQVHG
jgi:hypothetical protein